MSESELLEALANLGLESRGAVESWSDSSRLLSALDAIGRDGGNALVKVDGGRTDGRVYTVVVSGGRLDDELFRKDGTDLRSLLLEAIGFWAAHARSHPKDV